MDIRQNMSLRAAYTVEAAGVMSAVLLAVMILLTSAFQIHKEVQAAMKLHTSAEQVRHAVSSKKEREIRLDVDTGSGKLTISVPVFRPENSLRMWCLLGGEQ